MTRPRLATTRDCHLGEAVCNSVAYDALTTLVLQRQTREQLTMAIDALSPIERMVLSLYSYEELTTGEIGEVLSLCDADVILLLNSMFGHLHVLLGAVCCHPC